MPEIRTIGISDIRVWDGIPAMSVPKAPPVTVNIGVPIIDMPAFDPMDYRPDKLVMDPDPVLPNPPSTPTPPPPTPATPQLPKAAPADVDPRCPPLRAKEVGTLVQNGSKRIAGYEIQDGKCVVLYEEIKLPEQVIAAIPSLPQVTTVGVTAAVGVTAGLATPLLLKAVKPAVKKAILKVKALLGRKAPLLSVFERRQAQRAARK
tara:strand:+ start:2214 stop:2828 length:615 start_codon:yes stop_codon:yes gene_type:complete